MAQVSQFRIRREGLRVTWWLGSKTSSLAAAAGGGAPKMDSCANDHMSNGDLNSEALERTSTVGKPGWNFFRTKTKNQ